MQTLWIDQAKTHQGPQLGATPTASAIGRHQRQPPIPPPIGPKSPATMHRHAAAIANTNHVHATTNQWLRHHAATTTPAIGTHHQHPPLTLSTRPKGSGIAHKRTTSTTYHRRVATHQRPQPCTTTMALAIRRHQGHPPIPPSARPKGPGAAHKSAALIAQCPTMHAPQPPTPAMARNCHHSPGEPTPLPSTTIHRAATPRRRAQVHDVDRARRQTDDSGDGAPQ